MFNKSLRLKLEIAWLFRLKARLAYHKVHDYELLSGMPVDAFQVDCMFKGEQYQSHALFSEGRNKKGYIQGCDWDKVVEIGKLLAAGYKDREIGRKVNCDAERVSKIRKKIN